MEHALSPRKRAWFDYCFAPLNAREVHLHGTHPIFACGVLAMEDKVLRLMEEAMEADEGTLSMGQSLDWDSIAVVTFMALADEHFGKTLAASRLSNCRSVDDVVNLVNG